MQSKTRSNAFLFLFVILFVGPHSSQALVATVSEISNNSGLRSQHDLAVDKAGGVHVVYTSSRSTKGLTQSYIHYALRPRPDADWEFQTAIFTSDPGELIVNVSLAVNQLGIPSVACSSSDGTYVGMSDGNGGWNFVTIELNTSTVPGAGVDLQFHEPTDRYWLAYTGVNGVLGVAVKNGADPWALEVVYDSPNGGLYPSIVPSGILPDGRIAHYDAAGGRLLVSRHQFGIPQGAFWTTQIVDDTDTSGRSCKIRFLGNNVYGIAYQRSAGNIHSVYYAQSNGAAWQIVPVRGGNSSNRYGDFTGLIADVDGTPKIYYSAEGIDNSVSVREARLLPFIGWADHLFHGAGNTRAFSGVRSTESNGEGAPLSLLYRLVDDGSSLELLSSPVPQWDTTSPAFSMNPLPDQWMTPSIAVHPDGRKMVAFVAFDADASEYTLYYGEKNQQGFDVSAVKTIDGRPWQMQLHFNTNGEPRFAVLYQGSGERIIESLTISLSNSLHIRTVTSTSNLSQMDAALDPDGLFHIVFEAAGKIGYARENAGGSYDLLPLPSPGSGRIPSVAVSDQGEVAVCHLNHSSGELKMIRIPPGGSATSHIITTLNPANNSEVPQNTDLIFIPLNGNPLNQQPVAVYIRNLKLVLGTPGDELEITPIFRSGMVAVQRTPCHQVIDIIVRDLFALHHARFSFIRQRLRFYHRNILEFPQNLLAHPPSLALPPEGYPCVGTQSDFQGGRVLFCQPFDATDRDRDGVPLLMENALCMNPLRADSELAPELSFLRTATDVKLRMAFRVPSYHRHPGALGRIGEFRYAPLVSNDAHCWIQQSEFNDLAGEFLIGVQSGAGSHADPGLEWQTLDARVSHADTTKVPLLFGALQIERVQQTRLP